MSNVCCYAFQRARIVRSFPVFCLAEGSRKDLGKALVTCILDDILMHSNTEVELDNFIRSLGSFPPGEKNIADAATPSALAHALITATWRFPYVSGRAITYIKSMRNDVAEVIEAGIAELRIRSFPAFRIWDTSRHRNVAWDGKKLIKL